MSYRFIPWVRRGLATRITDPDPLTSDPPARARFPVRVTVNTGDVAEVDLRLFGPGDVIGLDPRSIVRTEPPRFARNFPPDQMVAVEFDPPDLPWLFTPAAPAANDRLRPWLVLVVVAVQPGVSIDVSAERPLPALTIEGPAVPSAELPDLAESWAWAHAHVVEAVTPDSVTAHLRDNPNLNVSRILCPRRLEPDRDYLACLVPAFEAGRLAGLGFDVPDAPTTAPAWGATGSVGATVTLPLYFHWELRTGPAGDFESLSRRLTPRPVPDTVGFRRMAITTTHASLPPLDPDAGGILKLEGALRAPDAGDGDDLPPELAPWIAELIELLALPAAHVVEGASADAEPVAPPIYGGQHVRHHDLASGAPGWLTELNTGPRHRAAAGLGTEVVRRNQERYMHSAWEQVGDVLAANALLDRARFIQEVADRIHRRHIVPLGEQALLALTSPVHDRVLAEGRPLTSVIARSTLPDGVLDGSFRRVASPRSIPLTRALRSTGVSEVVAAAPARVVGELAAGGRALDLLARVPDGLVSSRLLDVLPAQPTGEVGGVLGTVGTVAAAAVLELREAAVRLEAQPVPEQTVLRPDLAISGIVFRPAIEAVRTSIGDAGILGTSVAATVAAMLAGASRDPAAIGFAVSPAEVGGLQVEALGRTVGGALTASRPIDLVSVSRPVRGVVRRGGEAVPRRGPLGRLPTTGEVGEVLGRPPVVVLDPPVREREVVDRFVGAFTANRAALTVSATSVIPAPVALDLGATRQALVQAVDPRGVILARAALAVRIGDRSIVEGVAGPHVRQRRPLDPVMVGPIIREPLYEPLAKLDPDRFLPGIGEIPDDTVTMLETNPRFVEAFLVGANHEMNRELLWRRYPTDRRGTPFHRFWDRVDGREDTGPIHLYDRAVELGAHSGADLRGSLVLLVRGQLLRRYPNAVVSASPSLADGTLDPNPAVVRHPAFWGRIDPDVTFVGFDLTREQVQPAPGWYFVIAEQPTEPRFGLDVPPAGGGTGVPGSWSDLDWGHLGVPPGGHVVIRGSGLDGVARAVVSGSSAQARFGGTAADMAAITFQRPFRAAIHSSEVIEGASPAGGGGPRIRPVLTHSILLRPIALGGGG